MSKKIFTMMFLGVPPIDFFGVSKMLKEDQQIDNESGKCGIPRVKNASGTYEVSRLFLVGGAEFTTSDPDFYLDGWPDSFKNLGEVVEKKPEKKTVEPEPEPKKKKGK